MKLLRIASLGLLVLAASFSTNRAQAEDGFKSLFDGKSLAGWTGSEELWSVEDGMIVGSTDGVDPLKHNSFLATEKPYSNFELKVKFKLRNHNSGIQFRSKLFDDFVVRGYQADIADNQYLGILYEEGGRGILAKVDANEVKKHVKEGEWNEYVITADGPHITQKLNGFTTVDYMEKDAEKGATSGIIAFQLHRGPEMKIWFKDIMIRELPAKK